MLKAARLEPALRFSEFGSSSWELVTLGEYLIERKETSVVENQHPVLSSSHKGLVYQSEYYETQRLEKRNNVGFNVIAKGCITYRSRSDNRRFTFNINKLETGLVSVYYPVFNTERMDSRFLVFLLNWKRHYVGSRSVGTSQTVLSYSELCRLQLRVPSQNEQQKIADFLTSVDTRVQQLKQKQSLLQQYKKGLMQKLFSQTLRFKDDDGNSFPDWEEVTFEALFDRVTTKNTVANKNVLTISAQYGLVSQVEYFNHSVASKDNSGYFLLKKNDFAYNKSYSKGYPMGAIKRLQKYDSGIVSPLYICFRAKSGAVPEFYSHYFDAGLMNKEIHRIAQEGARNHGLLNMSVIEFFRDLKLWKPSKEEQKKIASALAAMDKKIDLVAQQIEHTQIFKKGLLQQMFV